MSSQWAVIGLSLAASFVFAASTSLKHATAAKAPNAQSLQPRKIAAFLRATVSHRLWLMAIGCDLLALALQIAALHLGALSVVQPLLISGLLFALILKRITGHETVSRTQMMWAFVLTVALAGFLTLAAAGPPSTADAGPDRLPAVLAGIVGLFLGGICVETGRRQQGRAHAAATIGAAVGMLYAASAALLKSLTSIATHSPTALVTSWQLYAVLTIGATGLFLNQLAFQAGPLSSSLPATATVDPLLSIVIGVAVFDEHINRGLGSGSGLLVLLVVMGIAVIQLARIPTNEPRSTNPSGDSAPPVSALARSAREDRGA